MIASWNEVFVSHSRSIRPLPANYHRYKTEYCSRYTALHRSRVFNCDVLVAIHAARRCSVKLSDIMRYRQLKILMHLLYISHTSTSLFTQTNLLGADIIYLLIYLFFILLLITFLLLMYTRF